MPRYARPTAPAFDAIEIEGALIAPAMLTKIAASQADGQTDASYHVPKGLTLRDEIARYFRIGQAQFRDFAKLDSPSTTATKAFVETMLRDVFGFRGFRTRRFARARRAHAIRHFTGALGPRADRRDETFERSRSRRAGTLRRRPPPLPCARAAGLAECE